MGYPDQVLGDPPEVALRRHPALVAPIEARQVERARIRAQGPLAAEIDVALEIAHHQLAHAAIDGLAEAQTREVRLRDGAPVAAYAVDADDVVGVLHGLEVEEQGGEAQHPMRSGGEDRALEAVRGSLAEHPARRPGAAGEVVGHRLERPLDSDGRSQRTQRAQFAGREAEIAAHLVRRGRRPPILALVVSRGAPPAAANGPRRARALSNP